MARKRFPLSPKPPDATETAARLLHLLGADPQWLAASASPRAKGLFVATKLYLQDSQKFRRVWMEIFPSAGLLGSPTKQVMPDDITKGQWRQLLEAMGATPAEIVDVLSMLGFSIP